MSTEKDAAPRAGGSDRSTVGVQLIDLCRSFGATRALNNLTIDINPGEFVAFLGPSGCGKTTALRIVAGLDDANSGQVLVGGKDIQGVPASKRDMGMVFQAYSLFPNLTARDNVAFGLRMRRMRRAARRRKADEMLHLVGLEPIPGDTRASFREASSSASRWPARLRSSRACCCSTSRFRHSTPRCAANCAMRSAASIRKSAPRPSS